MKHRLFVAIGLPQTHHQPVEALQKQIDSLILPIKWEPVKKLHLTLNFLGKVDESYLPNLKSELSKVSRQSRPFFLAPMFLETLYRRHEPSIIYLGFGGNLLELKNLQRTINDSMAKLKLPCQNRFFPHVTIGKLVRTDQVATKKFLNKISEVDFAPLPEFEVDHFSLYESHLSRLGSHYQKIWDFQLKH